MPHSVLREARLEDSTELTRLFIGVRTLCFWFLEVSYDFDFIRNLFEDRWIPNTELWVVENDGVLAGFISVEGTELDKLYVSPEWHGKGVGETLLNFAKEELSPNELWLWVFQKNFQAIRFYEKHGFTLDHETDGRDNMEKEPDARYVWRAPTR